MNNFLNSVIKIILFKLLNSREISKTVEKLASILLVFLILFIKPI